jgi:drug/metabolite transporter superfamily protein YnfA
MPPAAPAPPGAYAPPPGYRPEVNAGRLVLLLLFAAFGLAAVGLLIRYITGFMDPTSGVLKTRLAGTMFFAYGGLSASLSLFWAAYKVFEGQAVRVMAILGGIIMFVLPFAIFGA